MTAIHRPSVDLRHPRLIGAVGMAVFCFAALMSWRAGEGVVTVVFLVFVVLGLYLVLDSGRIAADGNVVTVSNPLGQYELAWQRVRRVECSAYGTLVLHADDARLVLPPPLLWSGPDRQALRAMIDQQLRARAIVVTPSRTADYRISKNVRVPPRADSL